VYPVIDGLPCLVRHVFDTPAGIMGDIHDGPARRMGGMLDSMAGYMCGMLDGMAGCMRDMRDSMAGVMCSLPNIARRIMDRPVSKRGRRHQLRAYQRSGDGERKIRAVHLIASPTILKLYLVPPTRDFSAYK
jgi:hypothetical protein